jgi:glycosyltransferase involved in cell wall biosynthesis
MQHNLEMPVIHLKDNKSSSKACQTSDGHLKQEVLVSIVLPVYNDMDTVDRCLQSLVSQTYSNVEILVVNDGSTDETARILREFSAKDGRIKIINIAHSGTSAAKNKGFESSIGDIIFFAEGDCIYEKDYVKKSIQCLISDKDIGGVCVLGGPWANKPTFVTRSINVEKHLQQHLLRTGRMKPYYAWVFSRIALIKAGLYDPSLKQAEDRDLFERVKMAGFKIGLVREIHWRHERNESTWQFARKSFVKGVNRIPYLIKWGKKLEFLRSVSALWIAIILAVLSLWNSFALWVLLSLVLLWFALSYYRDLRSGLNTPADRVDLLLLPIYQVIRYVSNAAGYTVGLILYPLKKASK